MMMYAVYFDRLVSLGKKFQNKSRTLVDHLVDAFDADDGECQSYRRMRVHRIASHLDNQLIFSQAGVTPRIAPQVKRQ
jgi:hypothetical protein